MEVEDNILNHMTHWWGLFVMIERVECRRCGLCGNVFNDLENSTLYNLLNVAQNIYSFRE